MINYQYQPRVLVITADSAKDGQTLWGYYHAHTGHSELTTRKGVTTLGVRQEASRPALDAMRDALLLCLSEYATPKT